MALNFQQVFDRIRQIALGTSDRQRVLDARRAIARQWLASWSGKTAELADKVERARQVDPSVRCAIPLEAPLDGIQAVSGEEKTASLIAADGSQILPDRHAALLYSLVNVGAIIMQPGSNEPPSISTESKLLFGDELYTETGLLTDEAIEQSRDIQERRKLLELAGGFEGHVVALTDGPVELWGAKGGGEGDYRKNVELHKSILSQLQAKDVIVAGYVDKPGADLLVRTLELASLTDDQLNDLRSHHPLRGVTDRWLFNFLPPGCRSAVFGLQSGSRAHYTGDLELHFFYLNVGFTGHPWLVRVEVPAWVVRDEEKLDLLQQALLQQCLIMGACPYPYILHRAHEIAVVKFDEKSQVEQMLAAELRRAGGEVGEESNKSKTHKLPGKERK